MFQDALTHIIARLDEARARGLLDQYALIGGLAVSVWAEPRATQDLDFAVALRAGSPQALASFLQGTYQPGEPGDPFQGVIATSSGPSEGPVPVRVIFLPAKLSALVFEHLHHAKLLGCDVPIVSWKALVLLKLYAGGPREVLDAQQIFEAQSPTSSGFADLRALAQRIDLVEEWEEFLKQVRKV